ncbi:hypothetical protein CcaverHIS002_0406540 [Cutaneotrichosporon cavernicola]|uniref:DUF2428 domain-containing protein n=1 Tax=Cutaneotrichosporon cavernicola TaxID=279322 RepID=A0AA48L4K1_9TREE|nr:uncharacterized protein CcaverHIS019_0406550 [Cutaneotrichosporon cavernicola]BEI84050.1 hypothetical protein CcaverHIS002_0406540 [Cutaneotrichosporon cavernicola]BEI91835.1 hypothetical protein CcaverHIS019_0406550 [Cutaneotrichosporon cavernicola]BEI99607.1 hypothetical protein CcaverHIS631_0406500 [Cutaneotrichosporon cavernicola]BEJ07383.1 hypothetical protein CcaverHIS641_0406520 [Cutaneotrichosporon cavernicola]
MERKTSPLEVARKELHRKKPADLTLDDLRSATDTALSGGSDLDVLGFAAALLRQLAASPHQINELVAERIAPALQPGAQLGALITANLAHNFKSRAQRSSELLTAAIKLVPAFPDLLSPLFKSIISDSLARKPNLLGITILASAVPDSAVPNDLLPRLLADVDEVDAASQRCAAVVALLARESSNEGWLAPLIPYLGGEASVTTLSRYLLPALTKVYRSAYEPLLTLLEAAAVDDRYFGPWVATASFGVSSGFITLEGLPQTRLEEGISHADLGVRVMAFELLAHSRAVFTPRVMGLVKHALVINTVVPTAGGRTEMRSAIHGFLTNMKSQEDQARRDLKKGAERAQATLAAAEAFHAWLLDAYLGPSVKACREMPHLRSIFALRLLKLYVDIYGPSVYPSVFTPTRVADLIACQASEFVDARVGARNLIALAPLPLAGFETLDMMPTKHLLASALASINHPRLTQAEAGRATLCILFTKLVLPKGQDKALTFVGGIIGELESHIQKVEENLARNIVEYPIHGPLSALVELVRCLDLISPDAQAAWRPTLHALNALVLRVWAVTRKVVSLGPEEEGTSHEIARAYDVLGEEDEEEGDHTNLLSGCWRATREAAELLAAIITVPLCVKEQTVWSVAEVDAAGRTFLLWLHEIRHRGTFSRIAPAFGTVVDAVQRIPSLSYLVGEWVDSQLDVVDEGKLSTLRRSAALPFTFLALLSDRTQRDRALDALLSMAALSSPSSDTTKVHAMNTLKIVLLDAKQSHALPRYLEQTLTTSLQAFGSANWAVRNVALILFSTVTNRALTTSRPQDEGGRAALAARQTLASWNKKYPSLLPYIRQTLRDVRGRGPLVLGEHSPLFPLLIIIRSLRWSADGEDLATTLYPAVEPFLGSPEWMVRAAAAQALSSLLSPEAGLEKARVTATRISHAGNEPNLRHGRLLFLRRLLEDVVDEAEGIAPRLRDALAEKAPPMISAAILDCVGAYVGISQANSDNDLLRAAATASHAFFATLPTVGTDLLYAAAARVLILAGETLSLLEARMPEDAQLLALASLERNSETLMAVTRLAKQGSNAVRTAALEALADWPEGGAEITELRDEMLKLAAHARSVPLKEAALAALGRAFLSTPAEDEDWDVLADHILSASDENQSEPRREAALSALTSLAPRLLALPTSPRARLLRALLALLEDDDVDIRSGAAAAMSAALDRKPVDQYSAVDAWWIWLTAHVREEREEWEGWLWKLVLPPGDSNADTRLFVEEPPNLFRNVVGVAERAASVLAHLGHTEGQVLARTVVDQIEDRGTYAPIDAGWAAAQVSRRRAAAVRTALGR